MRRLFLLLLLVAIALGVQAPAWLLARVVQDRSGGVVDLRNTAGTIWNGQADALVRGKTGEGREIPVGRVAWRVDRIDWQHTALVFDVQQTPAASRPALITLGTDRVRFAGGARIPAIVAGRVPLLAGWMIAGDVIVDTDALEWANGAGLDTGKGAGTAVWRGATLAPPDLPGGFALGEVTARIAIDGTAVVVSVSNSGGDVELTGDASSRAGTVALQIQPRASTSGAQIAWLQSHTMGRTPRGYTINVGWPGR